MVTGRDPNGARPWPTRSAGPSSRPGYVLHERRDAGLDDAGRARLEAMHLTRLATPEDVAAAVAFLAGPDAETITGVLLPVDGGSSTAARATSLG